MISSWIYIYTWIYQAVLSVNMLGQEVLRYCINPEVYLQDPGNLWMVLSSVSLLSIIASSIWLLRYGILNENFICLKLYLFGFVFVNVVGVVLNSVKGYRDLNPNVVLAFRILSLSLTYMFFFVIIYLWDWIQKLRWDYGFPREYFICGVHIWRLKNLFLASYIPRRILGSGLFFKKLFGMGLEKDSVLFMSQIVKLIHHIYLILEPGLILVLLNKRKSQPIRIYLIIKHVITIQTTIVRILSAHRQSLLANEDEKQRLTPQFLIWGYSEMVIYHLEIMLLILFANYFDEEKLSPGTNSSFRINETNELKRVGKLYEKYFNEFPRIQRKRLNIGNDEVDFLGQGEFGEIRLATMMTEGKSSIQVAVKFLKNGNLEWEHSIPTLLSDVKFLQGVDGKCGHLVKFYGVSWGHRSGALGIVMEYCSLGSLQDYLRNGRDTGNPAEIPKLERWAFEIASALSHLSDANIVHADVATRNVLLDEYERAKVTDFGMSLRLYNYELYAKSNQTIFPWRWLAPESLTDLKFSTKSDVWAYGVLLWELYSFGNIPWAMVEWTSSFVEDLKNGMVLEKPTSASEEIYG